MAGAAVLVLAFLVGTLGYLHECELLYLTETAKQILKYLSANVSTELASIAITILFADMLYQHRETEREKRRQGPRCALRSRMAPALTYRCLSSRLALRSRLL